MNHAGNTASRRSLRMAEGGRSGQFVKEAFLEGRSGGDEAAPDAALNKQYFRNFDSEACYE